MQAEQVALSRPRRSQRTDCHRPGAIVPTAYQHMHFYALPDPTIPGDRGLNLPEVVAYCAGKVVFGGLGKCGVCGASFNYGELWVHEATGEIVHMGHDCALKYHAYPVLSQHGADTASCELDVEQRSIRLTPTVPVLP